jgi:hypothetical protein
MGVLLHVLQKSGTFLTNRKGTTFARHATETLEAWKWGIVEKAVEDSEFDNLLQ